MDKQEYVLNLCRSAKEASRVIGCTPAVKRDRILASIGIDPATLDSDGRGIGLAYLRDRLADRFELVDVTVAIDDIDQVAVTLRRS